MRLERASDPVPLGLADLLAELGDGESGFTGTPVGRGTATVDQFRRACRAGEDPAQVPDGWVPQTVFWMTADGGRAVGMVRVRHRLNDRLLQAGGHVGYYVRRSDRRQGHATAALRQAVDFLSTLGVTRVLVTTDPGNHASARVAVANGGVIDSPGVDPDTGDRVDRYWIGASG